MSDTKEPAAGLERIRALVEGRTDYKGIVHTLGFRGSAPTKALWSSKEHLRPLSTIRWAPCMAATRRRCSTR